EGINLERTDKIRVKLYATLRQRSPSDLAIGEAFPVQITENYTVENLLKYLNISVKEAKIIMINGTSVSDMKQILSPDDLVVIFPPAGGG
ncbi:MAG: MoaD/ThiS family protein, partial [Candidatus Hodarchaeales archaeon]